MIGASVSEPTLVCAMRLYCPVDGVVQVARAAGLPRWLAGARYRICTTPRVRVYTLALYWLLDLLL